MKGGINMQNHTPIGYKISNGKIEIDKDQSKTVMLIYTDYLNSKTLNQIARHLTQINVPNANNNTNWTHGAVLKILENPKYLGDDFFPQIVSKIIFEKVRQARQERMRKSPIKEPTSIVKTYPKKPIKNYIPQDVSRLDEEIKNNPNDMCLIYKRAELFYANARIYSID